MKTWIPTSPILLSQQRRGILSRRSKYGNERKFKSPSELMVCRSIERLNRLTISFNRRLFVIMFWKRDSASSSTVEAGIAFDLQAVTPLLLSEGTGGVV